MRILLIDNFDSFTYNLVDYFQQLDIATLVMRNNEPIARIDELEFDAIVISPGPGKPQDAGITMQVIEKFHQSKPILGICLGHQAIGMYFGWTLRKARVPMHGKLSQIIHEEHLLFQQLANPFAAMRYHSLVIDAPAAATELRAIAATHEQETMIVIHEMLPIVGFQFHPESILTKKGFQLLKNWASIYLQ